MNLRCWMDQRGITVIEMAFFLGVTRGYLYNILSGERNPSEKIVARVRKLTDHVVLNIN